MKFVFSWIFKTIGFLCQVCNIEFIFLVRFDLWLERNLNANEILIILCVCDVYFQGVILKSHLLLYDIPNTPNEEVHGVLILRFVFWTWMLTICKQIIFGIMFWTKLLVIFYLCYIMFDLVIDLVVCCRRIIISLRNDLCTCLYYVWF